jgi:hypothetical protein
LALPMSCGVSKRELSGRVGESVVWIGTQIEALADELGNGR